MKTILLLLLASVSNADTTVQPCDHAKTIYKLDIAPKSSSSSMSRAGDICTIEWTPKPGQTVTFADKQAAIAALRTELEALEVKLDDGTVTSEELRRIIKIIMRLSRVSKE